MSKIYATVDDPETPEWAKLWGLIEQLIEKGKRYGK